MSKKWVDFNEGGKSSWFGTSIGVAISDRKMIGAVNGRFWAPISSSCGGCHPTESVWCQETELRCKSQNSYCWARQENKADHPRKEDFWSSLLVVTFPTWESSVCSTAEVISWCFWMAKYINNERLFPILSLWWNPHSTVKAGFWILKNFCLFVLWHIQITTTTKNPRVLPALEIFSPAFKEFRWPKYSKWYHLNVASEAFWLKPLKPSEFRKKNHPRNLSVPWWESKMSSWQDGCIKQCHGENNHGSMKR